MNMSIDEGELDVARQRGAEVLRTIKRYRGISETELAMRLGMTRAKVHTYVAGPTRLEIGLMAGLATALDVEPIVFFMTPDEALMWTITNRPNPAQPREVGRQRGRDASTTWYSPVPIGHSARILRLPRRFPAIEQTLAA